MEPTIRTKREKRMMIKKFCFFIGLIGFSIASISSSDAQRATTGIVFQATMKPLVFDTPSVDGVVWQEEYETLGSRFVRVAFDGISYSGDAPFEIRIVGHRGQVLSVIPAIDFVESMVTGELPTDDILIQV